MGDDRTLPRVKTNGLVVKELAEETLVYDTETNTALCLNRAASAIMALCDGTSTVENARSAIRELGSEIEDDLIWNTIEEFRQRKLLTVTRNEAFRQDRMSRRKLLRQAAALGVAVPIVMVLTAPPALHAASVCISVNQQCQTNAGLPCCVNSACIVIEGTIGSCQPIVFAPVPLNPDDPRQITIDTINGRKKSS